MLLERQFGNTINVKGLAIEAPQKEPEVLFDPERDLTEEDWERMKEYLEINKGRRANFIHGLKVMVLLAPERKGELPIDDMLREDLLQSFNRAKDVEPNEVVLFYGELIKLFFPENLPHLDLNNGIWEKVEKYVQEEMIRADPSNDSDVSKVLIHMREFKLLFPRKDFPEATREKVLAMLKFLSKDAYDKEEWDRFLYINKNMRIIFPGMPLHFDKKSIQGMRGILKSDEHKFKALDLKILAAKEIKITDTGMEIIMPERQPSFEQSVSPLPETKKF